MFCTEITSFNFFCIFIFRFVEVLQSAEDFLVDIPKLWEYLAEMVEPLFEDGAMTLDLLGSLSSSLGSLASPFVATVLKELVIAQVVNCDLSLILGALFVSTSMLFNHQCVAQRCDSKIIVVKLI